jgi:hypothetical protein
MASKELIRQFPRHPNKTHEAYDVAILRLRVSAKSVMSELEKEKIRAESQIIKTKAAAYGHGKRIG